jgi:hypothetical protein
MKGQQNKSQKKKEKKPDTDTGKTVAGGRISLGVAFLELDSVSESSLSDTVTLLLLLLVDETCTPSNQVKKIK